MSSEVAVVKTTDGCQNAFRRALNLIEWDDSNVLGKDVIVKIGVYDPRVLNHPTVEATKAVIEAFENAHQTFLAESDNRIGDAFQRLQLWRDVFTDRVIPFNLTEDQETRTATIIGESVNLSHILYPPHVRVNLHTLRGARGLGQPIYGSILKNLLGIIPDSKKERFHPRLSIALVDLMEAIGGVDLAILDASYTYYGQWIEGKPMNRIRTDLLIVGRDALAVDAVGLALVGIDPSTSLSLVTAARRGLGEIDLNNITIVGESIDHVQIVLPNSQ